MATAKDVICARLRKRIIDPRAVDTRVAIQEYRRLGCAGRISLKGLSGTTLIESLSEAIVKYKDAIAKHPEVASQFKESTAYVQSMAERLAQVMAAGRVLTADDESWITNAITEINISRYRIEGKTEKSSGWLSVFAVAAIAGGVWYFSRPKPPLAGMRRRRR